MTKKTNKDKINQHPFFRGNPKRSHTNRPTTIHKKGKKDKKTKNTLKKIIKIRGKITKIPIKPTKATPKTPPKTLKKDLLKYIPVPITPTITKQPELRQYSPETTNKQLTPFQREIVTENQQRKRKLYELIKQRKNEEQRLGAENIPKGETTQSQEYVYKSLIKQKIAKQTDPTLANELAQIAYENREKIQHRFGCSVTGYDENGSIIGHAITVIIGYFAYTGGYLDQFIKQPPTTTEIINTTVTTIQVITKGVP